jgi:AcrR family transcriptional regulator
MDSQSKKDLAPAAQKQKRGILTRRKLIRSARAIFAREGFENARLEDIALNAGKTRGAFYANFRDKEDVFFAIFEENIDRVVAELGPLLLGLTTTDQRIEALGNYLSEVSKDRQRTLLNLEFKLYAIRHPRKLKRFADLRTQMRLRCSISGLTSILAQLDHRDATEQAVNLTALGGVIDGLALNHLFDPEALPCSQVANGIKLYLREVL